MVKKLWQVQRELEYVQAREAYYANAANRPIKATVDAQPRQGVAYRSLLLRVGAAAPMLALQASTKAVTFFGGLAALGLSEDALAFESALNAPRGFKASVVKAMTSDPTPVPVQAYNNTGRRYIRYSGATEGESQAHYTAPISAGAADTAPLVDDLRTKFAAIKAAKSEQLGAYGRLYLRLEQYTQSGA
ncbi:hypothetical protein [Geitlerinema sp. PCC 7407]|uniref:hypothetical protein n=1 Tax=Geitlerinema sp. PCC 7407 TaxID=1173025 RepID=UPI00029FB75F|nr:hypothetical protein [Geitlerinema sp. PCC 7407]AFY64681.1 hypothetical protein GEI7407_0176 [Geitlerinema sp. PCC 7407]